MRPCQFPSCTLTRKDAIDHALLPRAIAPSCFATRFFRCIHTHTRVLARRCLTLSTRSLRANIYHVLPQIGFRLAQLQVDVSLFRDFFPGALEAATSSHCDADPTGRAPSDSSSTNTMDTLKARLAPDNTNADVALPQQADSSALPGTGVRMQEAYTTRNCTSALKRKRSEAETPVDCLCTSILRLIQLGDINAACTFYLQAIPPGDQVPPMALATQVGFQLGQMRLDLSMLHGFFPGAIKAAAAFRQSMHRQSREASPSHSVAASCKAETQRADGVALASAVASVLA